MTNQIQCDQVSTVMERKKWTDTGRTSWQTVWTSSSSTTSTTSSKSWSLLSTRQLNYGCGRILIELQRPFGMTNDRKCLRRSGQNSQTNSQKCTRIETLRVFSQTSRLTLGLLDGVARILFLSTSFHSSLCRCVKRKRFSRFKPTSVGCTILGPFEGRSTALLMEPQHRGTEVKQN